MDHASLCKTIKSLKPAATDSDVRAQNPGNSERKRAAWGRVYRALVTDEKHPRQTSNLPTATMKLLGALLLSAHLAYGHGGHEHGPGEGETMKDYAQRHVSFVS